MGSAIEKLQDAHFFLWIKIIVGHIDYGTFVYCLLKVQGLSLERKMNMIFIKVLGKVFAELAVIQ